MHVLKIRRGSTAAKANSSKPSQEQIKLINHANLISKCILAER